MQTVFSKFLFLKALTLLDKYLELKITLLVGGGGAMILAHDFPLATTDLDAIPKSHSPDWVEKIC